MAPAAWPPLEEFGGHSACGLAQLNQDLERCAFLSGGSDGEQLIGPWPEGHWARALPVRVWVRQRDVWVCQRDVWPCPAAATDGYVEVVTGK